jgi:4-amino-4-deoxy-L-arabinose transferase-like glycosyltransferase
MLRGDSGEFQWAMAALNVAHATGYPLFTLLGYGWQLLPLSDNVAWQLNLLAPLFGALATVMCFVTVRAVTTRTDAGLVSALFFALAPVIWLNASILEVYGLHAFLLTLLIYLLHRWSLTPDKNTPLYLAFFVLGLALAHHRLIILALPAVA